MPDLTQIRKNIKAGFYDSINRKPIYRISRNNGVSVEYHDLSDTTNLPFDPNVYNDTQIFLGSYANPWEFDFEKIAQEYAEMDIKEVDSKIPYKDSIEKEYHYITKQKLLEGIKSEINKEYPDSDTIPLDKGLIPLDFDIDSIAKEYDEFTYNEPIDNLVTEKHIIPTQRYKAYMSQGVLTDTFQAVSMDWERFKMVLYILLAISVFQVLVMLT